MQILITAQRSIAHWKGNYLCRLFVPSDTGRISLTSFRALVRGIHMIPPPISVYSESVRYSGGGVGRITSPSHLPLPKH